jgi:protein involved in sex pheromone biosynthesis
MSNVLIYVMCFLFLLSSCYNIIINSVEDKVQEEEEGSERHFKIYQDMSTSTSPPPTHTHTHTHTHKLTLNLEFTRLCEC